MATLLRTDGTREEVVGIGKKRKSGKTSVTLEQAQELVGGYVQMVQLNNRRAMLLNEEGKLIGLDVNLAATGLWQERYGFTDIIVGDVLITSGEGW